MNIRTRIERLSEAFTPANTSHEYTADEWIAGFEKIKEEHSPVIKYMIERFIEVLDGRNYHEVLDTDRKVVRFISYIFELIKGEHLNVNKLQYNRIKGIDRIIEVILRDDLKFIYSHQCGECGCSIPIIGEGQDRQDRTLFKVCPVCGGKIGYALYHYTQGGIAQ